MHLTDCDQCKKKNPTKSFDDIPVFFLQNPQSPYPYEPQGQHLIKNPIFYQFFFYHPGCNHRYVVYGLALKQETHVSILSTTVSTIVSTSEPEFTISGSNKTSHPDEQTTISKDIDSAVLVAGVFLIYLVFFIFAVMLYKMLKINSFWSFHLE